MSGLRIEGNVSGNVAEVNDSNQIKVVPETDAAANPENVGAVRFFSENDSGEATGTPYLASPETDDDYRLRIGADTLLDIETFNYTAQNTGKHTYASSSLTITYSTSGLTTNGSGITTTGTAATWGTYAEFPILGSTNTFLEFEASFSNAVVSNFSLDFGLFRRGGSYPYAPTDGVFFRLNASGLFGVISYNGAETPTPAFTFSYTGNHKYQFIIAFTRRGVEFWIDNVLYGSIETPSGQGQPFLSATLPVSIRHANTGTTSAVLQMNVNNYSLSVGGSVFNRSLSELGSAALGSYQGLSGGTMGSLASFANSANPTAAVPTNTTSTVLTGLGGQGWETDTLAVTTDGIICSYQNPLGTVSVQGKRLKVNGVRISSFVQTALTGGGYNAVFSLAFGHTAVSLATSEAVNTKAPRRIPLGGYSVASGLVALTQLPDVVVSFRNPIYVNSGEFIAIAKKKVGTAPSAGVIAYYISFDYAWE